MNKKQTGFTLIEIMIAVAIVGILASVAYSSYSGSIQKSKRADAKEALTKAAGNQEKHFLKFNQYSIDMADIGGSDTTEGYYTLSAAYILGTKECKGDDEKRCFTITATPTAAQAADTQCAKLTIDNLGRKRAVDNDAKDTSAICW